MAKLPRILLAFVLVLLLAGPALAQTTGTLPTGKYHDLYMVYGRALDSEGLPVSGGTVVVELEQEGVKAEPLRAALNCKGDFIADFTLQHVDPKGRVRVTLLGPDGQPNATTTVGLDPFYRRSDASLTLKGEWNNVCARETNVWAVSASVSVRLLNRTEPYLSGSEEFHARPYTGIVRMRYETPDGNTVCPPHPQDETPGSCELFIADERGDLRYTFTLDKPFPAGGQVELLLQEGGSLVVPIDGATRIGVKYFEITGRGAPPELYETPGAGLAGLALAIAVALAVVRSRR